MGLLQPARRARAEGARRAAGARLMSGRTSFTTEEKREAATRVATDGEFAERSGRVEATDAKGGLAASAYDDLSTCVLDPHDLVERQRKPAVAVARDESVQRSQLELPGLARAVFLLPPDRIASSAHGRRVYVLRLRRIRRRAQRLCGKSAGRLRQRADGPSDAAPNTVEQHIREEKS